MLQQGIPVFRNSGPAASLDSYLLEIKIILTYHLAQKTCLKILKILYYNPSCKNLCTYTNFPLHVLVNNIIIFYLCLYSLLTSVIVISR